MLLMNSRRTYRQPTKLSGDDRAVVYEFFNNNSEGILSMVDPDGNPHAAVMYYSIDEDFVVHFLSKTRTKKVDSLQRNNHVELLVYNGLSQTTAQLYGIAEQVTDPKEAQVAFSNALHAAYATSGVVRHPLSKLQKGEYVAYRIQPKLVRMSVYAALDERESHALAEELKTYSIDF